MSYHRRIWPMFLAFIIGFCPLLAGTNWLAFACNDGLSEIDLVDLGVPPSAKTPVIGMNYPYTIVITPDATRAVVACGENEPSVPNVFALDLTTSPISISTSTSLPSSRYTVPFATAMSPDGTVVFITGPSNQVVVLRVSDLSLVATIPSSAFGGEFYFIALSPNEPRGYVTGFSNKVYVIDTETYTELTYFTLPSGARSLNIAVTPDGSEVYVGDRDRNAAYYITVGDSTVHTIPLAYGGTHDVVAAPDGTAVYLVQTTSLTKIDTSSHTVVGEFPYPPQIVSAGCADITPDGKMVCVSSWWRDTPQYMAFLDTTTGASLFSPLQLSTDENSDFVDISITPDQAPTAAFTTSISGTTVFCDGKSSSSPIGTIAQYQWDFGDGQTVTTTSPTVVHGYATTETYTITLTVTNTAGTSTRKTFTGQIVKNNGGPSAMLQRQVSVQASGVASFKGKVHRYSKKRKLSLKTWWTKSLMPQAKKFQLFARKKKNRDREHP